MKMVIAVVQDEDSIDLVDALTEKKFRVTKLATTGGFLKSGNTTLMIGAEDEKIEEIVSIIKNTCKKRDEVVTPITQAPYSGDTGVYMQYPINVKVGGATVFVIDVDRFIQI